MQPIQSSNLPIWLSADGNTYKQLVCLENYNIPLDTQVTETATFCGNSVGLGILKFTPTGSAVCEIAPTGQQVTYKDMVAWQKAQTLLWFKVQYPSPGSTSTNIFLSGQCYVTNTTLQLQINDVAKFTFTLTGSGEIDVDPA